MGELEKGYEIARWRDNPWTPEGRERYESALRRFERLLKHPWLGELPAGKTSILDLGAGMGIGGVALARVLATRGVEAEVIMVDLREEAVKMGVVFAEEEGVRARAYGMDALDAHRLGKFGIVLMYGSILAHFDSWALPRLFASAAEALHERGVAIVEEMDRTHAVFTRGYRELMVENPRPEALSISVHSGYDPVTGSYMRSYIRIRDWEHVTLPINFRSISTIASTLWLFLEDIDIAKTGERDIYFILGRKPRKLLKPAHLRKPRVLERGEPWAPR